MPEATPFAVSGGPGVGATGGNEARLQALVEELSRRLTAAELEKHLAVDLADSLLRDCHRDEEEASRLQVEEKLRAGEAALLQGHGGSVAVDSQSSRNIRHGSGFPTYCHLPRSKVSPSDLSESLPEGRCEESPELQSLLSQKAAKLGNLKARSAQYQDSLTRQQEELICLDAELAGRQPTVNSLQVCIERAGLRGGREGFERILK